jgi:hypothetical protein
MKAGMLARGGRGTVTDASALASATGAATARAAMTPVAKAARLLIAFVVAKGLLLVGPRRRNSDGRAEDRGVADWK